METVADGLDDAVDGGDRRGDKLGVDTGSRSSEPFSLASISCDYPLRGPKGRRQGAGPHSFLRRPRPQTGAVDRLEATPDFWHWCEITGQTRDVPLESGPPKPLS